MDKSHDPILQNMWRPPINNHIPFFDGHNSHFDDRAPRQMNCRNIQPFILKAGNSINNQPDDNGRNVKLKYLYNVEKAAWVQKYGTAKFLSRHMNFVLVKSCYAFKVPADNSIRYRFLKTQLLPLSPAYLTTHTQECAASVQVDLGAKAEDINKISCRTVSPIEVQLTSSVDTIDFSSKQMVVNNHQVILSSNMQHMTL